MSRLIGKILLIGIHSNTHFQIEDPIRVFFFFQHIFAFLVEVKHNFKKEQFAVSLLLLLGNHQITVLTAKQMSAN